MIDELNLRFFKILLTDKKLGIEFALQEQAKFLVGHEKLAEKIISYIDSFKNLPTQRVLIEKFGNDEEIKSSLEEIYENLEDVSFDPSEYQFELKKLKDRFIEVQVVNAINRFKFEDPDPQTALSELEYTLRVVEETKNVNKTFTQISLKGFLQEFKKKYTEKLRNPEITDGIKTGYSYFDHICAGIHPAELVLIGGESGTGKSILLSNLAIQMWMQQNTIRTDPSQYTTGHNVLYFSLEMPAEVCWRRAMAKIADIPLYGLRDACLTKSETANLNTASKFIKNYPYHFEIIDMPRGVTAKSIEARYLEASSRFKPDIVIVDYMGLMSTDEHFNEDHLKLNDIAARLHELSRVYHTRVITAVQLNRLSGNKKNPEQNEVVGLHRIGRSALIATHCNIILQIEQRSDEKLRGDSMIHFIKNREGEAGSFAVQKKFAHGTMIDIPYFPPGKDEMGFMINGFEQEDISEAMAAILKL